MVSEGYEKCKKSHKSCDSVDDHIQQMIKETNMKWQADSLQHVHEGNKNVMSLLPFIKEAPVFLLLNKVRSDAVVMAAAQIHIIIIQFQRQRLQQVTTVTTASACGGQ